MMVVLALTAPVALAAEPTLAIPFERYQLENGLDVILHVDHTTPQVVVNTWYDVGSKDEVPGRTGFAHLFEHLMFMGTERLPDDGYDVEMERHGGWNNAWTSEDATDYYDVGPSHLLQLLLWMEADRMDGLSRAMTDTKLGKQRDIVRNERRQSYEDSPYGVAWLAFPTIMYPEGHPYAHSVIGSHEDLQAATVADVVNFFDAWYVPSNASLVVAGDFDPDKAKAWIAETYGTIPKRDRPVHAEAPPAVERPVVPMSELTDEVSSPRSFLAWHTPAMFADGDAAMDVLGDILSNGLSSRLYTRLVVEESVATDVDAAQYSQRLSSVFIVELQMDESGDCAQVEKLAQAEIDRLAAEGPTDDELSRVKADLRVQFLWSLESIQVRATLLNQYRVAAGRPDYIADDLARYDAVDKAAIQAAAAALSADRRATIRVRPAPSEGATP